MHCVIATDGYGLIEAFDRTAERFFGFLASEVIGRNVSMLMPQPDALDHDCFIANYRGRENIKSLARNRQVSCQRKDGSVFSARITIGEFTVGNRRLFLSVLREIREHGETEDEPIFLSA